MSQKTLKDIAWANQSASLVKVQGLGSSLESDVRDYLGWPTGRVVYDHARNYHVQADCAFPTTAKPQTIVSVTYTSPDKKGHSNENKLHLKVGELALLKHAYPGVKCVLVLGGTKEAWLPYVLKAFDFFFDKVIYLWEEGGLELLKELKDNHGSIALKHMDFWSEIAKDWAEIKYYDSSYAIPDSNVRYRVLDALKNQGEIVHHPSLIKNEVARLCMQRSRDSAGAEWDSYLAGRWNSIEMSRNYFNPLEAAVEICLTNANLKFTGGVARDIEVPSLLHDLGMVGTRVSEDFILFSRKLNIPVYIQCKSSGGGRQRHGKNIQNRTKEQMTRSLIYRSKYDGTRITYKPKTFYWISVLDGNWGVSVREPYKYVHMLQTAGYNFILSAEDLLDPNLDVKTDGNPLADHLVNVLDCVPASPVSSELESIL